MSDAYQYNNASKRYSTEDAPMTNTVTGGGMMPASDQQYGGIGFQETQLPSQQPAEETPQRFGNLRMASQPYGTTENTAPSTMADPSPVSTGMPNSYDASAASNHTNNTSSYPAMSQSNSHPSAAPSYAAPPSSAAPLSSAPVQVKQGVAEGDSKITRSNLAGRSYTVGQAPPVPNAITDSTPDVWYQEYQANRAAEAGSKEEERQRNLKAKKEETKGNFGFKIGKFFSDTSASVSKSVTHVSENREVTAHDNNIKQAKARLMKYWPHHDVGGFIVEFDCEGVHNNVPTRGHLLLTKSSLLFLGKGPNSLVIVDELPLHDIVSYSKGVSVPGNEKGTRWVMDLPNDFVKPDALQIFMNRGQLFNFLNFTHPTLRGHAMAGSHVSDGHDDVCAFDRFINYFDHAWRAANPTTVASY